jgi:uncharacterized protein (DUF924 family)
MEAAFLNSSSHPPWVSDVLNFWFSEIPEADWFRRNDALDATIRERFTSLHDVLVLRGGKPDANTPETLATIIVLDQFSRNMFRGTAKAFAADALALQLSRALVDRGLDTGLSKNERLFVYLPFEHSEDVANQQRSVTLFRTLHDEELLKYAIAHHDIVVRFGRFPHRNDLLGRASTLEEIEFLKQPGSAF